MLCMRRNLKATLSVEMHQALEDLAHEKGWRVEAQRTTRRLASAKSKATSQAAKVEFAKGLVKQYGNFLKDANRKRLRKGILEIIHFLPPHVISKLEIRLDCSHNNPLALAQALSKRVIFVPQKEFQELSILLYGKKGREPSACAFRGYAFLSLKQRPKEKAYGTTPHEVMHVVRMIANLSFGFVQDEALAVSLGLFASAHKSPRMREIMLSQGREKYLGRRDSKEYVDAVNLGRKAFLQVLQLEQVHGIKTARRFFHELFLAKEFNSGVISQAAQTAKQEALN